MNADGTWSFLPDDQVDNPGSGPVDASFTYALIDGDGDLSAPAEQAITVTDTAPLAVDEVDRTVPESGASITGSLIAKEGPEVLHSRVEVGDRCPFERSVAVLVAGAASLYLLSEGVVERDAFPCGDTGGPLELVARNTMRLGPCSSLSESTNSDPTLKPSPWASARSARINLRYSTADSSENASPSLKPS